MSTFSILTLLKESVELLKNARVATPALDAEILLAAALRQKKEFVYAHDDYQLTKEERKRFRALLSRRLSREPIAYILHKKEFYGLDFYVDRRVLIPRPETEELVGTALKRIAKLKGSSLIVDVGTGSGCIIISIARERDRSHHCIATDISPAALNVARENARRHGIHDHIRFFQGDLIEPILSDSVISHINQILVVANLPYITQSVFNSLEPEITRYEPTPALIAPKEDPYYYYRLLNKQITELKKRYTVPIYRLYETREGIKT